MSKIEFVVIERMVGKNELFKSKCILNIRKVFFDENGSFLQACGLVRMSQNVRFVK